MPAREWLERGMLAQSPIDALTDFWRGFNNLYGHTAGATELKRLQAFLTAKVSGLTATAILATQSDRIAYLISQPIIDMRGTGRNTADSIAVFHASGDPQVKLCAVFAMIYQVRCNLEHGQKSPTVDRDVRLCECSAPIVAAVIGCLT